MSGLVSIFKHFEAMYMIRDFEPGADWPFHELSIIYVSIVKRELTLPPTSRTVFSMALKQVKCDAPLESFISIVHAFYFLSALMG